MQKFKTNSSYKVIRLCQDPNIKLTFDTYYPWEKRNFDIINIENDNNILDIILENNQVDAIVVQYDGINSIDDMVYKNNSIKHHYCLIIINVRYIFTIHIRIMELIWH